MAVRFVNMLKYDFLEMKAISRFMLWGYAKECLDNNGLWFSKPGLWADPYEKLIYESKDGNGKEFPLKGRILMTCFSSQYSPESLWQRNFIDENSKINIIEEDRFPVNVRVKTAELLRSLKELSKSTEIENIYIGQVTYRKTEDLNRFLKKATIVDEEIDSIELLLHKRVPFSHEREIRIIVVYKDSNILDDLKNHYICPFNSNVISCIVTPPRLSSDKEKTGSVNKNAKVKADLEAMGYVKGNSKSICNKQIEVRHSALFRERSKPIVIKMLC